MHPSYSFLPELVLTRGEAAALLGVGYSRLDRLQLPRLRHGRRTLYRVADLVEHLERRGKPLTALQAGVVAASSGHA